MAVIAADSAARAKADEAGAWDRIAVLERKVEVLKKNQREIETLRSQEQGGSSPTVFRRATALMTLASALPDAVTLTALTLGPGTGFKPAEARELLAGKGFAANPANGWAYDEPSGVLVVRGVFEPPNR